MSIKRTVAKIIGYLMGAGFATAGIVILLLRPDLAMDPSTCVGGGGRTGCWAVAFFMNLPAPLDWLLLGSFFLTGGYAVYRATQMEILFKTEGEVARKVMDEAEAAGMNDTDARRVALSGVTAPERWLYRKLTGAERVTPEVIDQGKRRAFRLFVGAAAVVTMLAIITMAMNA